MGYSQEKKQTQPSLRFVGLLCLGVALTVTSVNTGCAEHRYGRVYDPYYRDNHRWNGNEVSYYQRWEVESHREHQEFRNRKPDEQKEYWAWRHNNDHDHDHGSH
jgi:hypothetical protein